MRLNLQGRKFRAGINHNPPNSVIDVNSRIHRGFEDTMFEILSEYFNFSLNLIDFEGEYGNINDNGQWIGLIGGLINDILPIVEFR
ncbi:hypothetical protein BLA29_007474 [Euroglyphus maynei]|uniref:Ionotropic glutamate receptor L-glutamate and glycine-binding domain-containing protein n=1 Tax=Euroglyphus maynei TaxID=6958 RepID=A0A1Y3AYQ4_EURMA|nr:hypothetical protein BLA29_007474 [Euroglyphus maynei]